MDFTKKIEQQRIFFSQQRTMDVSVRIGYLKKLYMEIKRHEKEITWALRKDLNKSAFDAYSEEIGFLLEEIRYTVKHLEAWSKPQWKKTAAAGMPAVCKTFQEPYGIVLIMSPWNYPFLLTLQPLIGAVAAGNCAVVKPSAYSPASSKVIADLIARTFPEEYVWVTEGSRQVNEDLLKQKFDYIFFTGGKTVGKVVMQAAAEYLTPMTLELGGKSPCIVDETADLPVAARRIVWGKYLNSGQTCVAPDYLLVQEKVKDHLLNLMKQEIVKQYGQNRPNAAFPKMVNEKHFLRVCKLIDTSGSIYFGGERNKKTLKIGPTILDCLTWEAPVMQEEIFGPVLPVLTFQKREEIWKKMQELPKPLAAYCFTRNQRMEEAFIRRFSFGGGCINDTIMHLVSHEMPFGGVGESGMGSYHGKESFCTFSHTKSILKKCGSKDVPIRYAPQHSWKLKAAKLLLK